MEFIKSKLMAVLAAVLIGLAAWGGHSLGSASGYRDGVASQTQTITDLQSEVRVFKWRDSETQLAEARNRKDWEAQVKAVQADKTRIENERDAQVKTLRGRIDFLAANRVLVDPGRPAPGSGGHNGKSPEATNQGGAIGADTGNELSPATSRFLWRFAGDAERVRLDLIAQVEYAKSLEDKLKACLRD